MGNYQSSGGASNALLELNNGAGNQHFFREDQYGGTNSFTSAISQDNWYLWAIDHPSGNTANILENGAAFESSYNANQAAAGSGTYNYTLGDDDDGGQAFTGHLGELIVYQGTLGSEPRQRVQSYLALKYGITIDQTSAMDYLNSAGTTIWDSGVNVVYRHDIAGIGRDDLSCLIQKQSRSVNSGSIVTIGLGNIATDNASNTNEFSADDSFLIWGSDSDDADQANVNSSDTPALVTERMERIWRVDETGTVGNVSVSFDLTGLGYSSNPADFRLIVSGTEQMMDGSTFSGGTFDGSVLTFSGVDFADGDYFTLGTAIGGCFPGNVDTDIYVWYKADIGTSTTTDGNTLSTWSDQSGNNVNATADGNPPIYRQNTADNINFHQTLDFDGIDDRLSLGNLMEIKAGASNGGDYAFFAVGVREDASDNYVLGSVGATDNEGLSFGYTSSGTTLRLGHINNDLDLSGLDAFNSPTQSAYLISGQYDGTGRILNEIRNGQINRTTDGNTTDISGSETNYIGDLESSGNYTGRISEVIIYDNDIPDISRLQINSYLAIKYGITLPQDNDADAVLNEQISGAVHEGDYVASNGTIIWDESNSYATYHNDIAGIGRDDDSCLEQKQAHSANDGEILTIGLGTVATDNMSNVNSFDTNMEFLIWGNDTGLTDQANANTVDVPTTIAERVSRVWRVEETGSVDDIEIQFDLTGLGYSSNANDFSLIVSNTGTMSEGTLSTGGTFNGDVLSFSGIDLNDGQYFTLGTQNVTCGPGGVNMDLALWLMANMGTSTTTDGADLSSWEDQSSPGYDASETNLGGATVVAPTYESNEINGNPVIRFVDTQSSNSSWMETTGGSNLVDGDMTLMAVFKTNQDDGDTGSATNSPAFIGANAAGFNDYALGMAEGRVHVNATTDAQLNARSTGSFNDGEPYITSASRDIDSPFDILVYVNSEEVGSGTSNGTALSTPDTWAIGNHSTPTTDGQFQGDIAEAIVFSKVLSVEERTRVDSYLAIKYGLTRVVAVLSAPEQDYLAADGGIVWDYDNQGPAYHNDMAGIGRDDLSCLEQLSSKSENDDALVTMSISSFPDNDSFLLWGNDGAPIEDRSNREFNNVQVQSRLNREWRVQETGTVGTIDLTFDLADITGPLGVGTNNLNQLRLMIDVDGDFTSGVTLVSPSSIDGSANTATFQVDFANGEYFTLGSEEYAALPIDLLDFRAGITDDNKVELFWTTASETNNDYFMIERSRDGLRFNDIGQVQGATNTTDQRFYKFRDEQSKPGLSYYRLKFVSTAGVAEYSEILKYSYREDVDSIQFKVYPNPSKIGEPITINWNRALPNDIKFLVFNPEGKIVYSGFLPESSQANTATLSSGLMKGGVYTLQLYNDSFRKSIRFIVL